VNRYRPLAALVVFFLSLSPAPAFFTRGHSLEAFNRRLYGRVLDHTDNHGVDRRIWSPALQQWRDLYVYVPPGFDPSQDYPVLVWLHGIASDEGTFLEEGIPQIDRLMATGELPPFLIALVDGTRFGRGGLLSIHSSFLNTRLGDYEDYLMGDVWDFLVTQYPIRPEREAHVLGGVSLGGGAAYHHAIKFRERFGIVLGIFPPLNVRWMDCHGNYFGNFDPHCWGWRTSIWCGSERVGRFGFIRVPIRRVVYPLYGRGPQAVEKLSRDNPIEMLDHYNVQPGELSMFVAYGGQDEFNIDAMVESFVYRARQRGLDVTVVYDPEGRHNPATARQFLLPIVRWLGPQLAPYSPQLAPNFHPSDHPHDGPP
jgi:S-formylglutathione hydrolase FrmB